MKVCETDIHSLNPDRVMAKIGVRPGTTLSSVAEQSQRHVTSPAKSIPSIEELLSFAYETTGTETYFRDLGDRNDEVRRFLSIEC